MELHVRPEGARPRPFGTNQCRSAAPHARVGLALLRDGWEGPAARCRLRSQVSGNGQTLLSGDQHGLIKVWDVRELKSREPR